MLLNSGLHARQWRDSNAGLARVFIALPPQTVVMPDHLWQVDVPSRTDGRWVPRDAEFLAPAATCSQTLAHVGIVGLHLYWHARRQRNHRGHLLVDATIAAATSANKTRARS